MKGIFALAALIITAGTAYADEGDYDDATYHHTVHAGEKLQIANARSWGPAPECASTGAKVIFTQRPAHGTITMDHVTTTVPEDRENCGGHPVATTRVFYTPSRGYQGPEHIGMDQIYGNGGYRHVDQDIEVTNALIPVHEGQVFREMPAPGSLKGQPGMSVYVADGSCPEGQVKQIVLGSVSQGIERQVSCVRR